MDPIVLREFLFEVKRSIRNKSEKVEIPLLKEEI